MMLSPKVEELICKELIKSLLTPYGAGGSDSHVTQVYIPLLVQQDVAG
jgi:hypothetical protein